MKPEGHAWSNPFILLTQAASNDKSFGLHFFSGGFPSIVLVTLTSLRLLSKIKHSPAYSWWTSDMTCRWKLQLNRWSWWHATRFGSAQIADMPLLKFFPSTALEDWGAGGAFTVQFLHSLEENKLHMTNQSRWTFSVVGLWSMHFVTPTSLGRLFHIKHSPGCSLWTSIDHDDTPRDLEEPKMQTRPGWLPFLLLPKRIKEPEGASTSFILCKQLHSNESCCACQWRAARHAACHSNFTLLGLKNQALSWLFSIEVSDELYICVSNAKVRKLQRMVIMMVHHAIWKRPNCRHPLVEILSFHCPRGSWSQRDTHGLIPSFSWLKQLQTTNHLGCTFSVAGSQA